MKFRLIPFLLIFALLTVVVVLALRRPKTETSEVKSSSMEPALYGPGILWKCPSCGKIVRTSVDFIVRPNEHNRIDYSSVRRFFDCSFCATSIPASSSSLLPGDRVTVLPTFSGARYDIVAFRDGQQGGVVKRVVGLPGETVSIAKGDLYINGESLRRSLAECLDTAVSLSRIRPFEKENRVLFVNIKPPFNQFDRLSFEKKDGQSRSEDPMSQAEPIVNISEMPRLGWLDYSQLENVRDFLVLLRFKRAALKKKIVFFLNRGSTFYRIEAGPDLTCVRLDRLEAKDRLFESVRSEDFFPVGQKNEPIAEVKIGPIVKGNSLSADFGSESVIWKICFVDCEFSFYIGEKKILSFRESNSKLNETELKPISIPFILQGRKSDLTDFSILRDLHYTSVPGSKPIVVPAGEYYLLGDNSPVSIDSRFRDPPTVSGQRLRSVQKSRFKPNFN